MNNLPRVLVLGAGRSATYLIDYFLHYAGKELWLLVADLSFEVAQEKVKNHFAAKAIALDMQNTQALSHEIENAQVVISMLPAFMHNTVANICLEKSKSFFTASYVSPELLALDQAVKAKKLLFLNEMGLDPGLDHISALHEISLITQNGGTITGFESYCGGLVSPQADTNPWHYKFSWNPRNVVLAGSGGAATFKMHNQIKAIPYHRLFAERQSFSLAGFGELEAYANRDSLLYLELYNLQHVETLIRGTFRYPDYCAGWHMLVLLGLTENQTIVADKELTRQKLLLRALPSSNNNLTAALSDFAKTNGYSPTAIETLISQFAFLGFFDDIPLPNKNQTAAQHLQDVLEEKWRLSPTDTDLVAMHHIFHYRNAQGIKKRKTSTLIITGEDGLHTAMAKTVGLPLAMAVRKFLHGQLPLTGVHIPNMPAHFSFILDELEHWGVTFKVEED